jgi:amino acid adenylation domain-containing protein
LIYNSAPTIDYHPGNVFYNNNKMKSSLDRKFLLSNREFIKSREYWMQRLTSIAGNENARLPFARPADLPGSRGRLDTELDPETARNLLLVCKNNDQAIYIYLLTCLKILLYKYTGRRNVTVGMPAADTGLTGGAAFGALLPVHNYLDGTGTFRSLLMQVKASVYEALPHQHYPVEDLLPELNVTDGLFDAVLLSHALHGGSTAGQPVVITLRTSPATGRVELMVAYRAGMHAWAKDFIGSFGHVIAACVRDPSVPINEINTWNAGETAETNAPLPARHADDRSVGAAGEDAPDPHADLTAQRRFWMGQFDSLPEVLRLPADFKRLPAGNQAGARVGFALDAVRTGRLRQLAEKEGTGLFTVLLAAYYVLLSKLSGQDDIVVGTPLARRPAAEPPVDSFANPLPLRNHPQPHLTFKEFLASVKSRTRACFDHPHYPYQTLLEELHPEPNGSRTPLFNVGFVYEHGEDADPALPGFTTVAAGVDLTLYATGAGNRLELGFVYSTALFGEDTVERWAAYLRELVDTVTANPAQLLTDVAILPEAEQHRLLHVFNDTRMDYQAEGTVLSLFERQAARTPDSVAVQDGTQRLTFAQLNRGADAIAREISQLAAPGEKPKIGLLFHPSVEMVVGMLAVLKAGGAYVPLSPEGSPQRNQYMLADCGARVLLAQQDLWLDHPTVALFEETGEVIPVSAGDVPDAVPAPDPGTTGEDILYVIYTSGTTGSPKGVEVKNAGIVNLLHFYQHLFQVEAGTRISQVANIGFDAAACEIWPSLVHGGCLVIAPADKRPDAEKMQKWLIANRIEISFQPTAIAEYLLRAPWRPGALRVMSVAGDRLNYVPAAPLPFVLYNLYGPSEDSVWTTWAKPACTGVPGPYSIGKPIANKQVFIVNRANQLQPLGVPGELCIAGAGLAKGYLNNDRLTKEKFVDCPFVPGARMYKTGDLARWLPTGEIEFLGRSDDQLKIRGFRIEPGEIESQLTTFGPVTETVVLAREKDGEKFLVAYYVAARPIDTARLRAYLGERLPNYMVPAHFVHLPRLPLTPNGKVNKKALPDPELAKGTATVAPSNPLEEQLVAVWEDILDRPGIGVTDNFFELGGHSLKAAQLIAWLYDDLGVTVELRQVFAAPTIRQLAQVVAGQKPALQREITPVAPQQYYPVSHAQKRMWVLDQLDQGRIADNMPNAYELIGPLDRLPLEKAFDTLFERHEMLRTAFATVAGVPVQRVNDHVPGRFTLDYRDLSGEKEPIEVARQLAAQEAGTPFALKEGPLLRVRLLQLAADRHVLLLTLHHIAADGWSMDILTREILALYAAYRAGGENPLAPLPLQYKDFAAWQQEELLGSKMKKDAAFWREQLREPLPSVSLKPDFPAGRQPARGEVVSFSLAPEVYRQLKGLREAHQVTSFSVVLAAFNLLLHRMTGQEDIVVGAPVSGRTHKSFEGQIGNFLNTIVIRTHLNADTPFAELLAAVSRTYIDAFEHQTYPFDLVVEDLNLKRNAGGAGLFDIGFTWMAANGGPAGPAPGFSIDDFDAGVVPVKADLWLHGRENEGRISLFFVYKANLYKKETIQLLVERFLKLIDQATARPATRAGEFDLKLAVEHALDNAKVSLGLDF